MPRRAHRKSRRGCLECKKRHIKCDESQPQCLNCTTVQRSCSYPDNVQVNTMPARNSPSAVARSAGTDSPMTPATRLSSPEPNGGNHSLVNMEHLELFHYFINKGDVFSVLGKGHSDRAYNAVIDAGLSTPYLMHEMLSLAALHHSISRPERQSFYRHQAAELQARAITMFNSTPVQVTVDNAVPVFLFSAFLGIHVLGELLLYRDSNFNNFLDSFTRYLRLHRAVRTVTGESWQHLRESDLRPLLSVADLVPRSRETRGHECDDLVALLDSADLSTSSIQACREAVDHLQWVFDGVNMVGETTQKIIHAWPVLVSEEYAQLLVQRKPEALVILAYFGVVVHHQREHWFFGNDGGRFIIRSVTEYLGLYWQKWLAWPKHVLETDSLPAAQRPIS